MKKMKISLYPTANGCLRPAEILHRARSWLRSGKKVAVASGDEQFSVLDGAILVRRVGKVWDTFHSIRPDIVIIDSLDFSDPGGRELISRQEIPHSPPTQVTGSQFRTMLDLLSTEAGAEEVLLVSSIDVISPAWKKRLDDWDVDVRWNLAGSTRWRSWVVAMPENDKSGTYKCLDVAQFPVFPGTPMSTVLHSSRSHLLLALAAEYSDLQCRDGHDQQTDGFGIPENPSRLLIRLLAGKPVSERIRLCQQLETDFQFLTDLAGEYLQKLIGPDRPVSGSTGTAGKEKRRITTRHFWGRTLH
ncbi:MAG: hypothetical protein F4206_16930 [Gammaproteobacteria bacterium]|nr:hypothetical protein [Gammaproteobacteria bacterium]MYG68393.1 hypothetical protein [Gammaproteobacteria bacterium]